MVIRAHINGDCAYVRPFELVTIKPQRGRRSNLEDAQCYRKQHHWRYR